jgi:hypothetical protein
MSRRLPPSRRRDDTTNFFGHPAVYNDLLIASFSAL